MLLIVNAKSNTFEGKLTQRTPSESYRIDVLESGNLEVTVAPLGRKNDESVKYILTLEDNKGSVIASETAVNYNDTVYLKSPVNTGRYTIIVSATDELSNRGVVYTLNVQTPDETDTLAPVVAINDSDLLANINGSVNINGTSTDANEIMITRLIINGSVVSTVNTGTSWEFSLDTTTYDNGTYQLVVESEDEYGNKGKSGLSTNIDNTPAEEDEPPAPEEDPTPPDPDPAPEPVIPDFLSGSLFESAYTLSNTSGWSYEESGATERIITRADHVECYAGGYESSTHYARVRRKLPERDNFVATKRFSIESEFELPSNFYTQHESYMRLITTDNYPASLSGSGERVGALSGDEWRIGFTIYGGDGIFRLISDHENNNSIVLWKNSSHLPVGKHTVKINFAPSRSNTGAWELFIDGQKVGSSSNIQTVPSSVAESEIAVTRVGGCLDGASNQDTKEIQVNLYNLMFKAER